MISIVTAHTGEALEDVITLAGEYVTFISTELRRLYPELDAGVMRTAHDYDDIRRKYPGEHVPPLGGMFEAVCEGKAAGCVALAQLEEGIAEMRTLFVRPEFRGSGTGRMLAERAMQEARERGYERMRLDTLDFMTGAHRLYRSLGFYDVATYREDIPAALRAHIKFFECRLREGDIA